MDARRFFSRLGWSSQDLMGLHPTARSPAEKQEQVMKTHEQRLRRAVELGIQEEKDPSVRKTRLRQLAELSDEDLLRRTTEDLEFGARREDWARAVAEEQGYRLIDSNCGGLRASDVGLYAIIDNATGKTIEADLDADDIDYFLSDFYEDEKLTEVDRRLFDAACFATTKVGRTGENSAKTRI